MVSALARHWTSRNSSKRHCHRLNGNSAYLVRLAFEQLPIMASRLADHDRKVKTFYGPPARNLSESPPQFRLLQQRQDRPAQSGGIARRREEAVNAVFHHIVAARRIGGDQG